MRFTPVPKDPERAQVLRDKVTALLDKAAIEVVPTGQEQSGYFATYFIVTKKGGGFRPILNLKYLNRKLIVPTFSSMEDGEWLSSIDLKDVYLHVPMHPLFKKYLRFAFDGIFHHAVQGSSIQDFHSSEGVHQTDVGSSADRQSAGQALPSVSGRLVDQSLSASIEPRRHQGHFEHLDPVRLDCQSQEVRSRSHAGSGLLGSSFCDGQGSSLPCSRQSSEGDPGHISVQFSGPSSHSEVLASSAGTHGINGGCGLESQVEDETSSAGACAELVSLPIIRQDSSDSGLAQRTFGVVGVGSKPVQAPGS